MLFFSTLSDSKCLPQNVRLDHLLICGIIHIVIDLSIGSGDDKELPPLVTAGRVRDIILELLQREFMPSLTVEKLSFSSPEETIRVRTNVYNTAWERGRECALDSLGDASRSPAGRTGHLC